MQPCDGIMLRHPIKVLIAVFFTFAVLCLTAIYIHNESFLTFDHSLMAYIISFRGPILNYFMIFTTNLGDEKAYLCYALIALLAYVFKRYPYQLVLQSFFVLGTTAVLNILAKQWFARPRPEESLRIVEAFSFSFPSGHSMNAMAFYGFWVYCAYAYLKPGILRVMTMLMLAVLILGVGLSRVYLGVHYPSDVIVGYIAGACWLYFCLVLIYYWQCYNQKSGFIN